jgi:hypothetical protein
LPGGGDDGAEFDSSSLEPRTAFLSASISRVDPSASFASLRCVCVCVCVRACVRACVCACVRSHGSVRCMVRGCLHRLNITSHHITAHAQPPRPTQRITHHKPSSTNSSRRSSSGCDKALSLVHVSGCEGIDAAEPSTRSTQQTVSKSATFNSRDTRQDPPRRSVQRVDAKLAMCT